MHAGGAARRTRCGASKLLTALQNLRTSQSCERHSRSDGSHALKDLSSNSNALRDALLLGRLKTEPPESRLSLWAAMGRIATVASECATRFPPLVAVRPRAAIPASAAHVCLRFSRPLAEEQRLRDRRNFGGPVSMKMLAFSCEGTWLDPVRRASEARALCKWAPDSFS